MLILGLWFEPESSLSADLSDYDCDYTVKGLNPGVISKVG